MATVMLAHMMLTRYLLLINLLLVYPAAAQLYKGTDADGNVSYSDTPFENAKKLTPPSLTIVDAPRKEPEPAAVEEEKPAAFRYTSFSISSPKNDETIWNAPQLTVSLKLKPALNVKAGHRIWLLMDDKPLIKNSRDLSLQIGRSDRGSHSLQAQVRNQQGRIIKRSKAITIHIKNTFIRKPAPQS